MTSDILLLFLSFLVLFFFVDSSIIPNTSLSSKSSPFLTSCSQKQFDITGHYRMAYTENFDELLQAIGVGYFKRMLANSVIPDIFVSSRDNPRNPHSHRYTVRMITALSDTSISMTDDSNQIEEFDEHRLDGVILRSIIRRSSLVNGNNSDGEGTDQEYQIFNRLPPQVPLPLLPPTHMIGSGRSNSDYSFSSNSNFNGLSCTWFQVQFGNPVVRIVRHFTRTELIITAEARGVISTRVYIKLRN